MKFGSEVASAVGHPLKGPELVLRIWESTAGAISKEVDSGSSRAADPTIDRRLVAPFVRIFMEN